ncbi:histidine--tRNA ligase, partial [Dubosiella newyorkensis]|uniref:histidine--tRNA ligase n=1 Tax=Dubosiella newyorkensis TaxID=1862672 RepID=UPI00273103C8
MHFQIPRGTQDILPAESNKWQALEQTLRHFCSLYDFKEIRTPIFEHTNVFKRENDSSDMVNKEMYTFQLENSNTSLTLRPEGTAGVVRSFVEHKMYANPDLPVKMYYMGEMARHERPQKGRLRLFHQFGVESLGTKSPLADVEVITLAFSILKALGLEEIKVLINTLGDDESRAAYRNALRDYFAPYFDSLCADCKRRYEQNPLRILDCKIDHDLDCVKNAPKMSDYLNENSKDYFKTVLQTLDRLGIPYQVEDTLVRG